MEFQYGVKLRFRARLTDTHWEVGLIGGFLEVDNGLVRWVVVPEGVMQGSRLSINCCGTPGMDLVSVTRTKYLVGEIILLTIT